LQQDVLDELEFEPRVNAAHIGVVAKGGVVALTGFVTGYAEKFAAEAAARRVRGAKAIAEEIEVRLPATKSRRMTRSPNARCAFFVGMSWFPPTTSPSRSKKAW
jgi:hypothetical protein